jgi:RND family efflux transporter MFP subunit
MGLIKKSTKNIWSFIKRHKISFPLVLIALVVLVVIFYPKPPKPISTQIVKKSDLIQSVSVNGKVDSLERADLRFQSSEKLSYVAVKEGDIVKKGQLIASLDQTQLQASLRQAEQDFTAAKAASEKYYDNHKNTESFDEKTQRTAIDAAQNKAYDQMVKVRADIVNSSLYSPIDGIVVSMDADVVGVNITPATTFTVANPDTLVFTMDVNEADVSKVNDQQSAKIILDAYPNSPLNLTISRIDFITHATTTGGNAYTVEASIASNPNLRYRIGMEGNANIITAKEENILSVPLSSLIDNNSVYVKKGKQLFEKRKVQLGIQNDTDVVITNGLSEGEQVVIDSTQVPQSLISKTQK